MSSEISPKADVSPKAKIGDGCKIFPFVYIEDDVVIGDNCVIFPFVSILNGSRIGARNKIHQGGVSKLRIQKSFLSYQQFHSLTNIKVTVIIELLTLW